MGRVHIPSDKYSWIVAALFTLPAGRRVRFCVADIYGWGLSNGRRRRRRQRKRLEAIAPVADVGRIVGHWDGEFGGWTRVGDRMRRWEMVVVGGREGMEEKSAEKPLWGNI